MKKSKRKADKQREMEMEIEVIDRDVCNEVIEIQRKLKK